MSSASLFLLKHHRKGHDYGQNTTPETYLLSQQSTFRLQLTSVVENGEALGVRALIRHSKRREKESAGAGEMLGEGGVECVTKRCGCL